MRVLLAEDDERLSRVIRRVLEQEGFTVETAADGASAVSLATASPPDVLVLDVMLPVMTGTQVARVLREGGSRVPILMLTALAEVHDRVAGLDAGADDYLPKPFAFEELLARLRALLRRGGASTEQTSLRAGALEMDLLRHTARLDGAPLELTPTEFRLLETLARQPGRVFTRAGLVEQVWGYTFDGNVSIVETYVSYLRAKLRGPGAPRIRTVRGVGYALEHP
jgi:DNA-binding response OmpR family regulator